MSMGNQLNMCKRSRRPAFGNNPMQFPDSQRRRGGRGRRGRDDICESRPAVIDMWFADVWIDDVSLANGKLPRTQEWAASILYVRGNRCCCSHHIVRSPAQCILQHACATEIDSKVSLQLAISSLATRCDNIDATRWSPSFVRS